MAWLAGFFDIRLSLTKLGSAWRQIEPQLQQAQSGLSAKSFEQEQSQSRISHDIYIQI